MAETLKLCMLGSQLPTVTAVLDIAVPLLIDAAAPPATPTPALVDAAVRLLGVLGSGPTSAAFRETVAGLPVAVKQRLQGALASSASAGPVGGGALSAGSGELLRKPPAIQLKSFALK